MSSDTARRRVTSGQWTQVGTRTFRLTGWPATAHGHVLAVCLDLDGVASHWTAAWLHGLVPAPNEIHVSCRRRRSVWLGDAIGPPVRVHTSTNLPLDDVTSVGAVPVTSVARTLLGLAAMVPHELRRDQLLDLVSTSIERGAASLPWLWWMLDRRRCRGRDGVVTLETALVARSDLGPTESWLEREVLSILDEAGIDRPVLQQVIPRHGSSNARVDFLYPAEWVILEALGYAFHRTEGQALADTTRANDLTVQGYQVLQFTSRQIASDPASLVATVIAARRLGRRRAAS
ncbi:MAG: type IV toxin-antitoxin system AbiEi family antitoxin [Iamia sp.]